MKGDDLNQLGICFKAHLRALTLCLWICQLICEETKQCRFTLQLKAGRLQQLTQVQQIGQAPFSGISFGLHAPADVLFVHNFVEHRQEALTLPGVVPCIETLNPTVPGFFFTEHLLYFWQAEAQGASGERCTQQLGIARLQDGFQNAGQIEGLARGVHTFAV